MTWQDMLGYMFGLMLEMQHRAKYYMNMNEKWKGDTWEKYKILAKSFGCACEETLMMELLREKVEPYYINCIRFGWKERKRKRKEV